MKWIMLPIAMTFALSQAVPAQTPSKTTSIETSLSANGQPDAIIVDLGTINGNIQVASRRVSNWNACGDQVSLTYEGISGKNDVAQVNAVLNFTRFQCVEIKEPVCKGFTCTTESRDIKSLVYRANVPVIVKVESVINAALQLEFKVTEWKDITAERRLLGNEEYYTQALVILAQATRKEFDALSSEITSHIESDRNLTVSNRSTALFETPQSGSPSFQMLLSN